MALSTNFKNKSDATFNPLTDPVLDADYFNVLGNTVNILDTTMQTKAPLASPVLTGVPVAPTAVAGTNTTQLATTAFVTTADNLKAPLNNPALTGIPTSPTAINTTNSTQIATTAFVKNVSEPIITAGTTSQYMRGDKTWQDFPTTTRGTVLTGFYTGANSTILDTDTVLSAFNKIQGQINARPLSSIKSNQSGDILTSGNGVYATSISYTSVDPNKSVLRLIGPVWLTVGGGIFYLIPYLVGLGATGASFEAGLSVSDYNNYRGNLFQWRAAWRLIEFY